MAPKWVIIQNTFYSENYFLLFWEILQYYVSACLYQVLYLLTTAFIVVHFNKAGAAAQ